jgi:hypothetical protein
MLLHYLKEFPNVMPPLRMNDMAHCVIHFGSCFAQLAFHVQRITQRRVVIGSALMLSSHIST